MKTELLEYHRERMSEALACSALTSAHQTQELAAYKSKIEFHERAVAWLESLERAVAWLESLDEGLAASAAAEKQIIKENLGSSITDTEEGRQMLGLPPRKQCGD